MSNLRSFARAGRPPQKRSCWRTPESRMRTAAYCTSCSLCRRRRETRTPISGETAVAKSRHVVRRRRKQSTLHLGCTECGRKRHMGCKMGVVRTTSHLWAQALWAPLAALRRSWLLRPLRPCALCGLSSLSLCALCGLCPLSPLRLLSLRRLPYPPQLSLCHLCLCPLRLPWAPLAALHPLLCAPVAAALRAPLAALLSGPLWFFPAASTAAWL